MECGKKRKMENEKEEESDDEEEEEKVKKFFALIRSTREMRDRLRNVPNGSKEEEEKKKKKQEEKSVAAMWNPKFQPEDFMEDSKSKNPLSVNDAGPSSKREQEKETKEGGEDSSLDLKLSL
ncbi:protein NIM1-INTERACTING 3-like [Durio zibethinus]|uniref:Protein NIM1-INTERACTING 3-like n=1 Tax=Durio zibethinus TaxID=66656 RepID=A0A6P5YP56_DURZI|nr:protein NIM1-INTERACTING 3-like [Durio zibethinus]